MNEFESDWISLIQIGGRVFLSESERRKQGVWIQHGRIQDGCNHHVDSEWMSEVYFVQMVGTNLGKCEWVWEEKLRWLNQRWPNSRWQNSRWLPLSSWVRMNEFESGWISLSQSFVQNGWIQDGCHHQVNQFELVWFRVFLSESERR